MLKKRIILIIDDNVTNLKVVVGHLKSNGFDVITARDGEAGLERAKFAQPDLILLDVRMPGIDGFECCRRLKLNPETTAIPVIFMTALSDTVDKVQGLELGAADYIVKPIEVAEMLARVNTQISLKTLQEQLQDQNDQLTVRVQERTASLEQQQAEKTRLMEVMGQQSDQLQQLTNLLIQAQQGARQGLASTLEETLQQNLNLIHSELTTTQNLLSDLPDSLANNHLANAVQILQTTQGHLNDITTSLPNATPEERATADHLLLKLSARERQVLQLLVDGQSNSQIAETLTVSRTTVHTYATRIKQKLDIHDLPGLVKFVLKHNGAL
ncbi:MAG: response regulator [Chloroflexota bacterium]